MSFHQDQKSEDDSASQSNFPPSPPPSHIFFPPTIFSPLIFPSNSPLASPLSSPAAHSLRTNPFDTPINSPSQRSNLFDSYIHDRPITPPPPQRPSSPVTPEDPQPSDGLPSIDLPDTATMTEIEDVRPPSQVPVEHGEWPSVHQESTEDLCFEDESLSPLERIYLFCRSKAVFHRVFIAHALTTEFLHQITPQDAVEYVLPLLSGLAMDDDEAVKEALSSELVNIIWWFLVNCRVVTDEEAYATPPAHASTSFAPPPTSPGDPSWVNNAPPLLSVQTFTPILGTLLLSPNELVGGSSRGAVVELLRRIKLTDDKEDGVIRPSHPPSQGSSFSTSDDTWAVEKGEKPWPIGLFHKKERKLFEDELFHQVVIGMGRLDMPLEEDFVQGSLTPGPGIAEPRRKSPLLTPNRQQPLEQDDSYFPNVPPTPPITRSTPPPEDVQIISTQVAEDTDDSSHSSGHSTPTLSPTGSDPSPADSTLSEPEMNEITPTVAMIVSDAVLDGSRENGRNSPSFSELTIFPANHPHISPSYHHSDLKEEEHREDWSDYEGPGYEGGEALDQGGECDDSEQAAVGRLSSMSLMAAVAASGSLADEMKSAFVAEVERVGRDPVFWVRREASYALGALAKVVPVEIVVSSLLPLLESLCQDTVWHVRHSALFALPAILSRISAKHRAQLALNTMLPLAEDSSASVRVGVLEALGEVIYTFHEDKDGVPQDLLDLFIGKRDGREEGGGSFDTRDQPPRSPSDEPWPEYNSWNLGFSTEVTDFGQTRDIWNDASRPLICAFNYPAVALTLGRERWEELRPLYQELSKNPQVKVRRTLAASLGELAKILGPENATRDLMNVFKAYIKAEEGEVRSKVIEALEVFVSAISDEDRWDVVELLVDTWQQDELRGWREREGVVRLLGTLVELENGVRLSEQKPTHRTRLLKTMLVRGLKDDVASVRDAAVQVLPIFSRAWKSSRPKALKELLEDVRSMASESKFSRRITFVACQQQLLLQDDVDSMVRDQAFWRPLERLASDKIVGVRIGVARLICELCDKHRQDTGHRPKWIFDLIGKLGSDESKDVRGFILPLLYSDTSNRPERPVMHRYCSSDLPMPRTFSRPPPTTREGESLFSATRSPKPTAGAGFDDRSSGAHQTVADHPWSTNNLTTTSQPPAATCIDSASSLHGSQVSQLTPSRPNTLVRTDSERLRALA